MARRPRASRLETRTARLKLPIALKPHDFTSIAPGISLGYRRCKGAGRWVVRVANGKGGMWTKTIAIADDHEDADGEHVLTFWAALLKAYDTPWQPAKSDHHRPFALIVERLGLSTEVTTYALRHTSITRALLAGVPIRVVAANHDTSVAMIEKTYARFISDHSEALTRAAMFDADAPAIDNVIPLARKI